MSEKEQDITIIYITQPNHLTMHINKPNKPRVYVAVYPRHDTQIVNRENRSTESVVLDPGNEATYGPDIYHWAIWVEHKGSTGEGKLYHADGPGGFTVPASTSDYNRLICLCAW